MARGSLPGIGIAIVLGSALFAAGVTSAWLWLAPTPPASLKAAEAVTTVPLIKKDFDDARTVQLEFTAVAGTQLTTTLNGRVTSTRCSPGSPLDSGTSLVEVDERPLFALATSVPLWRDIEPGDKGGDVKALQSELRRLGHSLSADGTAGPQTLAAVARVLNASDPQVSSVESVPANRFIWIPSPAVTIASCAVALGSTLQSGDPLAEIAGGVEHVSVQELPPNLMPGPRTLTVDAVTVPIDENGRVSDPSAVAQLAGAAASHGAFAVDSTVARGGSAADGNRSGDADGAPPTLTGTLMLAEPQTIGVVPPTAVYSISGDAGCISSDGVGYRATIVGSQLGQTYVQIDAAKELRHVDISPTIRPSCT